MDLLCQVKDDQQNVCWSEMISSDIYNLFTTPVIESDAIQAATDAGCSLENRTLHIDSECGAVSIIKKIKISFSKV